MGQQVTVAYYDPPEVHIPIHRGAQINAEVAGKADLVALIEQHVQEHLEIAQANARIQAAQMASKPPVPPGPHAIPPGGANAQQG
jgi:hypothetical protein